MAAPRRRTPIALVIAAVAVWTLAIVAGLAYVAGGDFGFEAIDGGPSHWDEETLEGSGAAKVALVDLVGEIVPGEGAQGFFSDSLGALDYVDQLRQAREDDSVDAVILRIDSPGGAVVASDDIYRAVRALDREKPVVALMGDVAASGGYYVAAGARAIVAHPSTITGSIGVIAVFINLEGTAQKVGLRPVVIKSGRHKDIGSPFRDMTREERRILQALIDEAYDGFVEAVAEGRGLAETRVRRIADGRILSGRQALALGLVDDLGGLEDALRLAEDEADVEEARLVKYRRPQPSLFGSLFGARSGGGDLADAVREAAREEAGLPGRSGIHYLWIR